MSRPDSTAKNTLKIAEWRSQLADLKLRTSEKMAIVEVPPSSCGFAIADSKKGCVCPPLSIFSWIRLGHKNIYYFFKLTVIVWSKQWVPKHLKVNQIFRRLFGMSRKTMFRRGATGGLFKLLEAALIFVLILYIFRRFVRKPLQWTMSVGDFFTKCSNSNQSVFVQC